MILFNPENENTSGSIRFHSSIFLDVFVATSTKTLKTVGRGGQVVEHRTFGQGDWGSKPPVVEHRTFRSKGLGVKPTCCCFEAWAISFTPLCLCLLEDRDTKSRWSLLPVIYARGSKRSQPGGKPVVDSKSGISNPLMLTPAAGAASQRQTGSVDGSNVVADSPGVYSRTAVVVTKT